MQWILFGDHKRVILRKRCAAKSLLLQIHKTTATKRHVMFGFQVKFVWSISSVEHFISTVRATDKKELSFKRLEVFSQRYSSNVEALPERVA